MSVRVVERLRRARALVARGWCQNTYARDAEGRSTPYGGPRAVQYCPIGAVNASYLATDDDGVGDSDYAWAMSALRAATGELHIAIWNDSSRRTKEQVLAAFDRAIEIEEKR